MTGLPVLPYTYAQVRSSGWSGSVTSKARADHADQSGTTSKRQALVLDTLADRGPVGITWNELATWAEWHHGTASGALSVLHKDGRIARLSVTRNRCKVYVLPEHVQGREVEAHGRKRHVCANCGHVE